MFLSTEVTVALVAVIVISTAAICTCRRRRNNSNKLSEYVLFQTILCLPVDRQISILSFTNIILRQMPALLPPLTQSCLSNYQICYSTPSRIVPPTNAAFHLRSLFLFTTGGRSVILSIIQTSDGIWGTDFQAAKAFRCLELSESFELTYATSNVKIIQWLTSSPQYITTRLRVLISQVSCKCFSPFTPSKKALHSLYINIFRLTCFLYTSLWALFYLAVKQYGTFTFMLYTCICRYSIYTKK